jgi:beta-N-acetylhexosaminidase
VSPIRRLAIRLVLALLLVLSALPAALGPTTGHPAGPVGRVVPTATPASSPRTLPLPTPSPDDRPTLLALDMAVGQMMAASFGGPSITDGLRHLILDEKVGTILIFGDNFTDAASLRRLTSQLQRLGREAGLPAPLLVAVDEEGGRVMRVQDGVTALPSELELGARGPDGVRQAIAATASGLHGLGIQLDLAPVADLRSNPADAVIGDRSFGGDPGVVGPLVAAAVNGLHDGGVAATLKHFPGLGGAAGDPHSAMPTDGESLERWAATQARSFTAGIDAGADAVMTTAVVVPGLDPSGTPALFSRAVVTGLLRERLGFQGVIVTDGLGMGGISALYGLPDATVAAVRAGNDLVLLNSADAAYQAAAIEAVKQHVRAGTIAMDQVQASAARVIALRARWPGWAPSLMDVASVTPSVELALSRR